MTLSPQFWLTAILAVTLIGIAKSGFGGGVAVVSTPLLAMTMPVAEAAALLLPLLLVADFFSLRHYKNQGDRQTLWLTLPPAVIGIILGGLFFNAFRENEATLKVGIGLIAILFVLYQTLGVQLLSRLKNAEPPNYLAVILGGVAGFTSTIAHVGGPPYVIYLILKRFPPGTYVGTSVIFFTIVNLLKLIPYGYLGLLKIGNLATTLALVPFAIIGVFVGVWLNRTIPELWFNRVVYILLTAIGLQLLLGQSLLALIFR